MNLSNSRRIKQKILCYTLLLNLKCYYYYSYWILRRLLYLNLPSRSSVTSYDLQAGAISSSTVCQMADRSSKSSLNCSLNDVIWGALGGGTVHWTSTVVSVTLDTSGLDGANKNDPDPVNTYAQHKTHQHTVILSVASPLQAIVPLPS